VLDELGLIRLTESEGVMEIRIPRIEGKVELSRSDILKRLA